MAASLNFHEVAGIHVAEPRDLGQSTDGKSLGYARKVTLLDGQRNPLIEINTFGHVRPELGLSTPLADRDDKPVFPDVCVIPPRGDHVMPDNTCQICEEDGADMSYGSERVHQECLDEALGDIVW